MSHALPLFPVVSRVSRYDSAPKRGKFAGDTYDPKHDDARLTGQIARVFELMRDGYWRTLAEIEAATGDPQASISAQLRHLRKNRFGAWIVLKRSRGERSVGLYEYQLNAPENAETK